MAIALSKSRTSRGRMRESSSARRRAGRRVGFAAAIVATVENGEITYERRILDFTGVLVQVGVLKAKPDVNCRSPASTSG